MKQKPLLILISIALLIAGCVNRHHTEQLKAIAALVNEAPDSAQIQLNSIDISQLNNSDRNFYDFLSIKAKDKAYIVHTSDSLIRSVIEYYESEPDYMLPEVYYYGGRVYFDLGDAPQALEYFQKSLDIVDPEDLELKGRIVSQMGKLYKRHYQYSYSISKIKESIEIDKQLSDSFGLAYDNGLLAGVYLAINELDSAIVYYNNAVKFSSSLTKSDEAIFKISLSYVLSRKGELIKARKLIPPELLNMISKNARPLALSRYIHVYMENDEYDWVKKFIAEFLKYDGNIEIKSTAYGALAEIDIATNNVDSLFHHLRLYKWATDSLNRTISREAMEYQHSYFNYSLRERENIRLLEEKHNREILIWITISILILVCLISMYLYNANKRKKLRLELALSKIRQLDREYKQELKKRKTTAELKDELIDLIQQRIGSIDLSCNSLLPASISESEIYQELKDIADDDSKIVKVHHWDSLSKLIDETYPQFQNNLAVLLGEYSNQEYKICMLTKCEFSPTSISKLTLRTKGALSNSRMRMCQRAFGERLGATYWDKVVRSL